MLRDQTDPPSLGSLLTAFILASIALSFLTVFGIDLILLTLIDVEQNARTLFGAPECP